MDSLDREKKLELIQRSLGIRHKLRVHETMKAPDTHEEMAALLLSRWELEDELRAIEELIGEIRQKNVDTKTQNILKEFPYGNSGAKKKPKKE